MPVCKMTTGGRWARLPSSSVCCLAQSCELFGLIAHMFFAVNFFIFYYLFYIFSKIISINKFSDMTSLPPDETARAG